MAEERTGRVEDHLLGLTQPSPVIMYVHQLSLSAYRVVQNWPCQQSVMAREEFKGPTSSVSFIGYGDSAKRAVLVFSFCAHDDPPTTRGLYQPHRYTDTPVKLI